MSACLSACLPACPYECSPVYFSVYHSLYFLVPIHSGFISVTLYQNIKFKFKVQNVLYCIYYLITRNNKVTKSMCTQGWSNVHFSDWFPMILCTKNVFHGLTIHHPTTTTCISHKIIPTIPPPKLTNTAPLQTCVIRVTDSMRHRNTDYSGLERSNTNISWYWYGKNIITDDAGNHNQMSNH